MYVCMFACMYVGMYVLNYLSIHLSIPLVIHVDSIALYRQLIELALCITISWGSNIFIDTFHLEVGGEVRLG